MIKEMAKSGVPESLSQAMVCWYSGRKPSQKVWLNRTAAKSYLHCFFPIASAYLPLIHYPLFVYIVVSVDRAESADIME